MPMTEQQWSALARHLREIISRVAPDWTTGNSHDPGITVLEVLNYALTDLRHRRPLDDSARSLVRDVAGHATALAEAYGAGVPRRDPYANYNFRVKWDGRYVAGVSKVSALKRTTDVVEHREGGDTSTRRLPGSVKHEPITLERGITHDREFEAWANAANGTRKDVFIELFNEAGQLLSSYKVPGCWVSQYQALPELDAQAHGTLIEMLRIECEGWQRIDNA
jgi:phage tail-like protein